MGIFKFLKLIFSLHITIIIIQKELKLNRTKPNLTSFLKVGNQVLSEVEKINSYKWINERGWKDLQKIVTIGDAYKNLVEYLERNELT